MSQISDSAKERILTTGKQLHNSIGREPRVREYLSLIDRVTRTEEGLRFAYDHIEEISASGVFSGTSWNDPTSLVPTLVKGTLCSGFPLNVYEVLSELRMLKIALGEFPNLNVSSEQARRFLEEAIISNIDIAFSEYSEALRAKVSEADKKRISGLFSFIFSRFPIEHLKGQLAAEVVTIAEQRPILTDRIESIIRLVASNVELDDESEGDETLRFFVAALLHPTKGAREYPDLDNYRHYLSSCNTETLRAEAAEAASRLSNTGVASEHLVVLVRYLAAESPSILPDALGLNAHGRAEFEEYSAVVTDIIDRFLHLETRYMLNGLARLLERTLLSRRAILSGLQRLMDLKVQPEVGRLLMTAQSKKTQLTPTTLLVSGTIAVLGMPLGIGQGNNPTCQSARGISMWSRHSPGKLLTLIITAATANRLDFRYEGELIISNVRVNPKTFDFNLDPVSIVLVPHLDDIYGQMMQRAMMKHIGSDPHVSVNPAFYGHWIPSGFTSCYNTLLGAIQGYDEFVRLFYASFHPEHNGGHQLVYPAPLGIFITSSKGDMLGFHAVSLLRVDSDPNGKTRAYFFNPNNEGRQDWGQEIRPTVTRNGERHGESSLPFDQFCSRVYAFHYNTAQMEGYESTRSEQELNRVEKLARESWGRAYTWL